MVFSLNLDVNLVYFEFLFRLVEFLDLFFCLQKIKENCKQIRIFKKYICFFVYLSTATRQLNGLELIKKLDLVNGLRRCTGRKVAVK